METKVDLKKYTVSVQGKDFITFPGLLALAHEKGLKSITTEFISQDPNFPVMKATVTLSDGKVDRIYNGVGDASAKNCAPRVANALFRMAETRSIARALRFACNVDMTALEELGVEDNEVDSKSTSTQKTTFTSKFTKADVSNLIEKKEEAEVKPSAQLTPNKPTFVKKTVSFTKGTNNV